MGKRFRDGVPAEKQAAWLGVCNETELGDTNTSW